MPKDALFDIGAKTVAATGSFDDAKTIFANGPAGVYENRYLKPTGLWHIADSPAYSVAGGDTISSATRLIDISDRLCVQGAPWWI